MQQQQLKPPGKMGKCIILRIWGSELVRETNLCWIVIVTRRRRRRRSFPCLVIVIFCANWPAAVRLIVREREEEEQHQQTSGSLSAITIRRRTTTKTKTTVAAAAVKAFKTCATVRIQLYLQGGGGGGGEQHGMNCGCESHCREEENQETKGGIIQHEALRRETKASKAHLLSPRRAVCCLVQDTHNGSSSQFKLCKKKSKGF